MDIPASPHSIPHVLRDRIDRLMDEFNRALFPSRWMEMTLFSKLTSEIRGLIPDVDMIDEEKAYRVTAELPGLSEKDIEVTKDGDLLTIKGEKSEEHEEKEKGYFLSERHFGSVDRSLRLVDLANALDVSIPYFLDEMSAAVQGQTPSEFMRTKTRPENDQVQDPLAKRETLELVRAY